MPIDGIVKRLHMGRDREVTYQVSTAAHSQKDADEGTKQPVAQRLAGV